MHMCSLGEKNVSVQKSKIERPPYVLCCTVAHAEAVDSEQICLCPNLSLLQ